MPVAAQKEEKQARLDLDQFDRLKALDNAMWNYREWEERKAVAVEALNKEGKELWEEVLATHQEAHNPQAPLAGLEER